MKKFGSVGLKNYISIDKISAIANNPNSAPIKRMTQSQRDTQNLIDMTEGRKAQSVIFLTTGQIVLSSRKSKTLIKEFEDDSVQNTQDDDEDSEMDKMEGFLSKSDNFRAE